MTKPEFTPGPWCDCQGSIGLFDEYGEYEIADVLMTCNGMTTKEWRANCRLIEAAPEMYAELKRARDVMQRLNTINSLVFSPLASINESYIREINALLARIDGKDINVPSREALK